MTALAISNPLLRTRIERMAEILAGCTAAAVPWSTSITSILAVCWLVALLPTLDFAEIRRSNWPAAALLPIAIVALAVIGLLWAVDVSWKERLGGLTPYAKLLAIPLLMWQFSRREGGERLLWMFLASACVLLAASLFMASTAQWMKYPRAFGIPVRDYISQSGIFTLCFFALIERAVAAWEQSRLRAGLYGLLACLFMADILFIALARTTLIVIAVLFLIFGLVHLKRKGLLTLAAAVIVLAALSWSSSDYLRKRITSVTHEIETFTPTHDTSSGARLEFWKTSLEIIRTAPVIGHGTGSIRTMFARETGQDVNAPGVASNPHNQILAVAIPWGIAGVALLLLMWASHLRMFLTRDFAGWIGLSIVVQNIVSSLFNSHITDFTQGWLYAIGVGTVGGMVWRNRLMARQEP